MSEKTPSLLELAAANAASVANFTCLFHGAHNGICPLCTSLDRSRGRTLLLAELHAQQLLADLGVGLASMTPFDVATCGIMQGMLIGLDLAAVAKPSVTRENIEAALAKRRKSS